MKDFILNIIPYFLILNAIFIYFFKNESFKILNLLYFSLIFSLGIFVLSFNPIEHDILKKLNIPNLNNILEYSSLVIIFLSFIFLRKALKKD